MPEQGECIQKGCMSILQQQPPFVVCRACATLSHLQAGWLISMD